MLLVQKAVAAGEITAAEAAETEAAAPDSKLSVWVGLSTIGVSLSSGHANSREGSGTGLVKAIGTAKQNNSVTSCMSTGIGPPLVGSARVAPVMREKGRFPGRRLPPAITPSGLSRV